MLAVLLVLAGCGMSQNTAAGDGGTSAAAKNGETAAAAASSGETAVLAEIGSTGDTVASEEEVSAEDTEGEILCIYAPSEDFRERVKGYYPDYEETSTNRGKIGDVEVVWHIEEDVEEYREELDEQLKAQAAASSARRAQADEIVDLYVVEESFARDYIEGPYALDVVADLGLTQKELSDQFPYTRQIATDAEGAQRGVSWQATPGVFVYRRSIAKKVLGTDDPDQVQKAVSSWAKFEQTAAKAWEEGYYMLSGYDDAYRVYADNVSRAFVVDDKLAVDEHLLNWAQQTRRFIELGYSHGTEMWSDEWEADHSGDGQVFGFFYSNWSLNYTFEDRATGESLAQSQQENTEEYTEDTDSEEPESAYGDYAVCKGPEAFHWGGQWVIGAAGTDNPTLVRQIMEIMTCDEETLQRITRELQEFTNTQSGMEALAQEENPVKLLGGQNPYPLFVEVAGEVDQSSTSVYDADLDEGFQVSMRSYIDGEKSVSEALENFYSVAQKKYPELTVEEEENPKTAR